MDSTMQTIEILFFALSSLVVGTVLVLNGIKNGLIKKRILVDNYTNRHAEGSAARAWGVFNILAGLSFLLLGILFVQAVFFENPVIKFTNRRCEHEKMPVHVAWEETYTQDRKEAREKLFQLEF